ncbi:MAG: helix-turn-helix transcriptional regulator, partial [Rhodospirillales bacterium]|nr:helix-turn-helix transcriptional regulator [Rhodospirillales bacterium]
SEVVSLILRGYSSISIGSMLDISVSTVKVHRKNIYAKLHISSQAELFSLFLPLLTRPAA